MGVELNGLSASGYVPPRPENFTPARLAQPLQTKDPGSAPKRNDFHQSTYEPTLTPSPSFYSSRYLSRDRRVFDPPKPVINPPPQERSTLNVWGLDVISGRGPEKPLQQPNDPLKNTAPPQSPDNFNRGEQALKDLDDARTRTPDVTPPTSGTTPRPDQTARERDERNLQFSRLNLDSRGLVVDQIV